MTLSTLDTSSYTEYDAGKLLNNRYKKVADLNKGSYGQVSLAKDTKTDELVAIKCLVNSSPSTPEGSRTFCSRDEIDQEIAIHSALNGHKNVAQLLDHFSINNLHYLVVEYCAQGDLYEAISGGRGPKENGCTREFMLQLVDALIFCHSRGVYHRDIKPENILISKDGTVKLADWGLATFERHARDFGVGSDRYMAPELFDGGLIPTYDARQADIWSVGICLLNILFGRNPFTKACSKDKLFMDFAANREALFDIFPAMTPDTFAVLRHSLTIDPDNRSLEEMRNAIMLANAWTTDEEFEEFVFVQDDLSASVPYYDSGFGGEASNKTPTTPLAASVPSPHFVHFAEAENASVDSPTISLASPVLVEEDVVTTCSSRLPLRTPTVLSPKQQHFSHSPWDRTMQYTPPAHRFSFSNYKPKKNNKPQRKGNQPRKWVASSAQSMESLSEESDSGDDNMFRMDDELPKKKKNHKSKHKRKSSFKTPRSTARLDPSDLDVPSLSNTSSDSSKASVYIPPSRRRNNEVGALSTSVKKLSGVKTESPKPDVYRPPFLRKSQPASVPTPAPKLADFSAFNLGKSWGDLMSDEEEDNEDFQDLMDYMGSVRISDQSNPTNPMKIPLSRTWQNWVA